MKNPFPALITYMLIQTAMSYPLSSSVAAGAVVLIGWGMVLNEVFSIRDYYQLPEATRLK